MKALHSEGKCLFCGETFIKAGISRHLNKHLSDQSKNKTSGKSFHVRIEAAEMFLNLWIDGKTKISELDLFLRSIWLECCGHMSAFFDPKKRKTERRSGFDFFDTENYTVPGEISKKEKTANVFFKGMKLTYDYDFGSTTRLDISVIEEIPFSADKNIVLLSRNEPLEMLCHICNKKLATEICSVCAGYDDAMFCKECAKIHEKKCEDFADYAQMPVVNSPRMGVCAYEGGEIDRDRDGVYIKK